MRQLAVLEQCPFATSCVFVLFPCSWVGVSETRKIIFHMGKIGKHCHRFLENLCTPKLRSFILSVLIHTHTHTDGQKSWFCNSILPQIWYDMIYLLTAIGLSPGGSSTVHIYTQTIHRTIQNKQYIEQQHNFGRVWAVPLSWLVIPWHLPYSRGKSTEKLQSG